MFVKWIRLNTVGANSAFGVSSDIGDVQRAKDIEAGIAGAIDGIDVPTRTAQSGTGCAPWM